jgi:hypothetical protein
MEDGLIFFDADFIGTMRYNNPPDERKTIATLKYFPDDKVIGANANPSVKSPSIPFYKRG